MASQSQPAAGSRTAAPAVAGPRAREVYDVVVVGAGLAGLQAAQQLMARDRQRAEWARGSGGLSAGGAENGRSGARRGELRVVVVEAHGMVGGRVRGLQGLVPWTVEMGPEFIHGDCNCSIKAAVDQLGCQQTTLAFPDHYYFGKEQRLVTPDEAESDPEIAAVHAFFAGLKTHTAEAGGVGGEREGDCSVVEVMRREGATPRQLALAESIYANDFGCSLRHLGMHESVKEARGWVYGDTYVVCDQPFSTVVHHLAQGVQVRCHWPVAAITYDVSSASTYGSSSSATASPTAPITLTSRHGEQLQAKRVIVTVPLPVLQAGDIQFSPPLPSAKQRAIGALRMGCAVKVIMAFSHRVWPSHLFDIVCTDSFLPEVWFTRRSPPIPTSSSASPPLSHSSTPAPIITAAVPPPTVPMGQFLAVGFAAGDAAEAMARLPPETVISRALEQLDAMFRHPCSTCKPGPGAARAIQARPAHASGTTTSGSSWGCQGHGVQLQALPHGASDDNVGTFVVPARPLQQASSTTSSCPAAATSSLCSSCHPASASFVSGCFADWSRDAFIRGAYTHPTVGAGDARDQLAMPLGGRLFFAGEATHFGVNPCMQGALDTGTRVANEVFWSLQGSRL
ncbi:hypothetical protein CLOM_g15972 [Closterium sp. NIES-68]|nr:hypothetical protein CLOM_g15972 [Closterium sp. NIES-68]GJP85682.1 hypothetical protein CLOP_g15797 [Closterium sp. NIES-67]